MSNSTSSLEGARSLLARAPSRSIVLVRHGNTGSAAEVGGVDFDRVLSAKGTAQCDVAARSWLPVLQRQHHLAPDALVVCSSAGRCVDTARRIFGERAQLLECAALYDGTMQPASSALFDKLGYAPLRPYHEEEGGAVLLRAYAEQALAQVETLVAGARVAAAGGGGGGGGASPWVICCHAIYTNQLCLALAEAMGLSGAALAVPLDTNLQETDGFVVSETGVVRLSDLAASADADCD
jgi:broad specificity phosphatase PhoE